VASHPVILDPKTDPTEIVKAINWEFDDDDLEEGLNE
jgi:hypothetical protein